MVKHTFHMLSNGVLHPVTSVAKFPIIYMTMNFNWADQALIVSLSLGLCIQLGPEGLLAENAESRGSKGWAPRVAIFLGSDPASSNDPSDALLFLPSPDGWASRIRRASI